MLEAPSEVTIVSCDIVAHSAVADQSVQWRRVAGLNDVVRAALSREVAGRAVWASGGDGGHVLFLREDWVDPALLLVRELRHWAVDQAVPLRITAHVGKVLMLTGADGRVQPVGDGINDAGAILELGGAGGIVVSQPFREGVESHSPETGHFHDERHFLLRARTPQKLVLLSLAGFASEWEQPPQEDREAMQSAAAAGDAWQTLYNAKRVLQLDSSNMDVNLTLRRLKPSDFWYHRSQQGEPERIINPFFGYLEARELREVVKSSHLVERRQGAELCRYGDGGDTMFVVLRGSVGVYNLDGESGRDPSRPEFIISKGEVAGELAFLLERHRTADLVAMSDVALLAFSFEELSNRLLTAPGKRAIMKRIERFMTSRILEHVGHNASFLIGKTDSGPLTVGPEPAESLLEDLAWACRIVSWSSADGGLSLLALSQNAPKRRGLYVLVTGQLESIQQTGRSLRGEDFPLLYVDVEPTLLGPDHEYAVHGSGVKLLHIGQDALDQIPQVQQAALIDSLKKEVSKHYAFDIFISYNFVDEDTVERWMSAFTSAGLAVYVDRLSPGERFTINLQRALLDSLTLMPFVSPNTMVKRLEANWVLKEIAFREEHFEDPWIVPVALPGADLDTFGLRYTMVDARGDEARAINAAIATVRAIRSGHRLPPRLKRRNFEQQLD